MKIGEVIRRLEKSEAEKKRILTSLKEGKGLPKTVFDKYASKIENEKFWKSVHKVLHITGFRPNKGNHIVIKQVLSGLSKNLAHYEAVFWEIYDRCILQWLTKEKIKLNMFLLSYAYDGDKTNSGELFKTIAKNRLVHEIDKTDILECYEVWWFDRIDQIESFISIHEINEDSVVALIKKNLGKSEYKLTDDDKKSYKLVMELTKKVENVECNAASSAQELNLRIDSLKSELDSILRNSEKYDYALNDIEKLIETFEKNIKVVNERISQAEVTRNDSLTKKESLSEISAHNLSQRLETPEHSRDSYLEIARSLVNIIHKNNVFYISSQKLFNIIFHENIFDKNIHEVVLEPALSSSDEIYDAKNSHQILLLKNFSAALIEATVIPLITKANSVYADSFPKIIILDDHE